MTLFEDAMERARLRGEEKGIGRGLLIGRIQHCQEMLGLEAASTESLSISENEELEKTLRELEGRLRNFLGSAR